MAYSVKEADIVRNLAGAGMLRDQEYFTNIITKSKVVPITSRLSLPP